LVSPFFCYILVSWACWDCPLTWLTNHCPSVLWHCWLGRTTRNIVSENCCCMFARLEAEWDVRPYYTKPELVNRWIVCDTVETFSQDWHQDLSLETKGVFIVTQLNSTELDWPSWTAYSQVSCVCLLNVMTYNWVTAFIDRWVVHAMNVATIRRWVELCRYKRAFRVLHEYKTQKFETSRGQNLALEDHRYWFANGSHISCAATTFKGYSRSSEVSRFDRVHMISCYHSTVTMALSCIISHT